MHRYYAYGIRNSFGLAFDPVTGNLWDTENGPDVYDEINIVKPGFNSGWIQVMGPISRNTGITEGQLVNFPGSHYADPVFSWRNPVAVTDIEFMKSSSLVLIIKTISLWEITITEICISLKSIKTGQA